MEDIAWRRGRLPDAQLSFEGNKSAEAIYLIYVAEDDLFNGIVLKNLTNDASVATTDNENFFWVWMTCKW